jgi:hypothetical protein
VISMIRVSGATRCLLMGIGLVLADILSVSGAGKVNPGGPFLSVTGDLVPCALCLAIFACGVLSLRSASAVFRVILLVLLLLTTVFLASVVEGVILFWFWPYARGALIGR